MSGEIHDYVVDMPPPRKIHRSDAPAGETNGATHVSDKPVAVSGGERVRDRGDEIVAPEHDPSVRQRLVRQFEAWLDRALAGEAAPAGLPAELLVEAGAISDDAPAHEATDLYSLYSALTALTGEIRLQGRAFRQVSDSLAPLAEFPAGLKRLEAAQFATIDQLDVLAGRASEEDMMVEKGLPSAGDVMGVFLDLYDRLKRGMRTFEGGIESLRSRPPTGWLARLTGASAQVDQALASAEAMGEGYRLTLARLEAALGQWDIERIGREGDRFDPRLMTAIEVQPAPGTPDGTVLEVCRCGYMLRGKVIAVAQVRVSKT